LATEVNQKSALAPGSLLRIPRKNLFLQHFLNPLFCFTIASILPVESRRSFFLILRQCK